MNKYRSSMLTRNLNNQVMTIKQATPHFCGTEDSNIKIKKQQYFSINILTDNENYFY